MPRNIEPEILREMKIEPLVIPGEDHFQPRFTEEEMQGFDHRDKEMLKSMKTLQNMLQWSMGELVRMNESMQFIEADLIRIKTNQKSVIVINKFAMLGKAALILLTGGVLGKLGEVLLGKFLK